jgi:anti-anti-sigma regulatory factor
MLHETPSILAVADSFFASPNDVEAQLQALYDRRCVIIDLRGVDRLDPAFVAELGKLGMYRRAGGQALGRLIVDSRSIRNALSAVGFERNWPIYRTLEHALASFELQHN